MPCRKQPCRPGEELRTGFLDYIISLIYPERCLYCGLIIPQASEMPLCLNCQNDFFAAGFICPRCDQPVSQPDSCFCRAPAGPLKALFALTWYNYRWRRILHDLKYRKRRSLARPVGYWLAREIKRQGLINPDLIVPVPLHKKRETERGFNQSLLIAEHAALALGANCRQALVKKRETLSQTKISRRERVENVRGVFEVTKPIAPGSVVLLIDDIYSTGATMNEAAMAIKNRGITVYGAVIAYNPRIN